MRLKQGSSQRVGLYALCGVVALSLTCISCTRQGSPASEVRGAAKPAVAPAHDEPAVAERADVEAKEEEAAMPVPVAAPASPPHEASTGADMQAAKPEMRAAPAARQKAGGGVRGGVVGGAVGGIVGVMSDGSAGAPAYASKRVYDTAAYDPIEDNAFKRAAEDPLSTFSIDVDTASYANVRRFLTQEHRLPPKDAVRVEELINYFTYDYPNPKGAEPFSITTEVTHAPWNRAHRLVHIGVQGKRVATESLPPNNLVFLVDVSGSMAPPNRLPLLKAAFRLLVDQLRPQDRVAIVVYAGAAGLALPSTAGSDKTAILAALENLDAGGSTAGAEGIQLAYDVATKNFLPRGNNRVILATDGDFNVGVSSDGELVRLIEEKRKTGVYLTVLGVGTDNYKDAKMEKLADKGNGQAHYIDDILEAQKVLVNQMGGTLLTIAKDVKIQVEFNPAHVEGYRLVGYENRVLAHRDFNDDTKDAGELGAGHSVTVLYEVIPAGAGKTPGPNVDALKYQAKTATAAAQANELLTVKLRYKPPTTDTSKLLSQTLAPEPMALEQVSNTLKFASAVAEFGLLLRDSKDKGSASYAAVLARASAARGRDAEGYREDFVQLVKRASVLAGGGERTAIAR